MIVCASCGSESPDDMRHCVQCGARLPDAPVAPEAPGHTSHFGDDDLKNLMARIEREGDEGPADANLLAGLPRPKVGSMLSPLRGGQTAPTTRSPEKRARSASGSTVMGMPLFTTGEQRAVVPAPRPREAAASDVPAAPEAEGGASIMPLGSFQGDFGGSAPPAAGSAEPSAPASTPPTDAVDEPAKAAPEPARADLDAARRSGGEPAAPDAATEPVEPVTSPDRPTTPVEAARTATGPMPVSARAPEKGGSGLMIAVVIGATLLAAAAFFLLK